MVSLSSANSALKTYYLDAINAQLNGEVSPFFNAITKTSENVFGKDVAFTIAKGNLAGIAMDDDDSSMPLPRSNRYYSVKLPLKNIFGTIQISDKTIRASSDASGALVNIINAEMDGLVAAAKASFARMLYGDGDGYLFTVTGKKSAHVLAVDNAKDFFVGYTISIKVNDGSMRNATITAVDKIAKTITVTTDFTSVTFDGGEDAFIANSKGYELLGLKAIFDGTTLYGYNKAENSYFAPKVKHVAINALTEDDLMDMIDSLEEETGEKVNMILCSHNVRRKLASLMGASRRIVNTTEISAGYSSIIINDVPVYADKFCPDNRIYFVNSNDFSLNQLCDWTWLEDEDGAVLKQVIGRAAYTATLVKYAELICKRPCGQGLIMLDEATE